MDDDDFSEDERKAFRWLLDENQIQRTHRTLPSGKVEVTEADLSGGQDALVRVLRGERPTHPLIRQALACALEPIGSSLLQLKKRLRRRPGRPGKTEKNAVQDAFDVHASEPLLVREKQKIQVKRPQPAVGTKRKLVTTKDAVKSRGVGRSKYYDLRSRGRKLHVKHQKSNNN